MEAMQLTLELFFIWKPYHCLKLFHITFTKFYSVLKLDILGMLGGLIQQWMSPNVGISIIYGKMDLSLENISEEFE